MMVRLFNTYPFSSNGAVYIIKINTLSDSGVNITYLLDVPNVGELLSFNTSEKRNVRYIFDDSQEIKKEKVINNALCTIFSYLKKN
ncbi:hypothetical protein CIY_26840 [Butyrivibrio fibrisolvens 16/4]|nr:hypothetical protein CIY_26840 [Butyrivibrio fibrisolvens 16/4]